MTAVVYWLLDAEDNVLYVGCTEHLRTRMGHHASVQQWWPSVASVATTEEMPRDMALQVEREDINTLRPTHNVQNKPWDGPRDVFTDESFDLDSFDAGDYLSTNAAARALGVNVATVNRWAKRGDLPIALKISGPVGVKLFHRADIEALAAKRAA